MKSPRVVSAPDILGGTPVFVGTRVPVRILFEHLEAVASFAQMTAVLAAASPVLARPASRRRSLRCGRCSRCRGRAPRAPGHSLEKPPRGRPAAPIGTGHRRLSW
jgi:hypothetical protein